MNVEFIEGSLDEIDNSKIQKSEDSGYVTSSKTSSTNSFTDEFSSFRVEIPRADEKNYNSIMDKSIQVNFPIVVGKSIAQWKKAIRRHKLNTELLSSGENNQNLQNSWIQLNPIGQSSNSFPEAPQRTRLTYHSETPVSSPRLSPYHSEDFTSLNHQIQEKQATKSLTSLTLPAKSNYFHKKINSASIPSGLAYIQSSSVSSPFLHLENNNDSLNNIKCTCNPQKLRRKDSCAPQNLSWRRLHMSRAKLKATATTSELLSGFAMVAMVELQINEPTSVPEWLFVMFAVCTTVLVAVHIFALMISTYILPNIDAISKLEICELVTESPHERMRGFIELAWAFSTILGLFLFLVEVAILCWVKFWDTSFMAAIAATVIVIPVLIIFVLFSMHFYHSLVIHKYNTSLSDVEKLEDMKKNLDQHIV